MVPACVEGACAGALVGAGTAVEADLCGAVGSVVFAGRDVDVRAGTQECVGRKVQVVARLFGGAGAGYCAGVLVAADLAGLVGMFVRIG